MQILQGLYKEFFKEFPDTILQLPGHASARKLFRISGAGGTCLGAVHTNIPENRAFIGFARSFLHHGLNVPEILIIAPCETVYLMSDLGDQTLFERVQEARSTEKEFPQDVISLYKDALTTLVQFQVHGATYIDFSLCYEGNLYGRDAMYADLLAFENKYLHRVQCSFDSRIFKEDSARLVEYLSESPAQFFMYRDFQSRNIVIQKGKLGYVDFQAGRMGPLQYDVVSLLFQSQAGLTTALRSQLLEHYLAELAKVQSVDVKKFKELFYGYVLLRLYQVLATYGEEGLGNRKPYFLHGIPIALGLLKEISEMHGFPVPVTELARITNEIVSQESL